MATLYRYRIYCSTESLYVYTWAESEPSVCPNNNAHTITSSLTTIVDTVSSTAATDSSGKLKVSGAEETLFGELKVSQYTPVMQNYSLYGMLNNQMYKTLNYNGGSAVPDSNGSETQLIITNGLYSYSLLRSTKVLKYRPGYSNVARFNLVFDTPIANCLQFGGLGNNGSDLYFCYDGTDFGIRLSTNGRSEVRCLTVSVDENDTENATIFLDGVEYTVPLTDSKDDIYFTAFEIANFSYPGWNVENIGDTVVFQSRNVGSKNGTYSFSSTGQATGSFSQTGTGSALSTTFVNQNIWNGPSSMVSTLDPQKRNMYCIDYSWYGSGNILYKIYNPDTSRYEVVHTLKFANLQSEPSLSQPNMFLQLGLASLGSTTTKTVKASGGFAATDGKVLLKTPIYGAYIHKSIRSDTETVLLCLKNRNTINGFSNQSEMIALRFSFSTSGNKPVTLKLVKNPTTISDNSTKDYIGWKFINESQSIGLCDTVSSSYTGGQLLDVFVLPKDGNLYIDLKDSEITLFQNDILVFSAESTKVTEIDLSVTILDDL